VTRSTDVGDGNLDTVRIDVAHLEGVAAGQGECRIGIGHAVDNNSGRHRLHVAAGASIGYHLGVRCAGYVLAVGDGIHAFEHVTLRAVMRSKGDTARPIGLIQGIFSPSRW